MGMQVVGCCPCTFHCRTQGFGLWRLPCPPGPAPPTLPGTQHCLWPGTGAHPQHRAKKPVPR